MLLGGNCNTRQSHISSVNWGCISVNLKTPPTFDEGRMTAKHSWSLLRPSCLLQGGGVKYSSDGRINIGSSWWRAFRWRGVPFSLRQILSLLSHLNSFSSHPSTLLLPRPLFSLFDHQTAAGWTLKGTLASAQTEFWQDAAYVYGRWGTWVSANGHQYYSLIWQN